MRYVMLALMGICTIVTAGPVGRYLGFAPDRVKTGTHYGRDSIHFYLPTPSDSVIERFWDDTTTVLAETVYQGAPAWLIERVSTLGGRSVTVDTAAESGDTMLRQRVNIGDSLRWANQYRVPFQVGRWWRTGLAGTYYLDINGDSLEDTLTVWGDTTRVAGIETVTVPFGTVENCYKLLTAATQSLALKESTFPIRETSFIRSYEWYKDSLTLVKDSLRLDARVYMQVFIWLRAADVVSWSLGRLTALYVGIEEPPERPTADGSRLTACPNPFTASVRISLTPDPGPRSPVVDIYDRTGRLIRTIPISQSKIPNPKSKITLTWDGRDSKGRPAPPGVYLVRGRDRSCLVTRVE